MLTGGGGGSFSMFWSFVVSDDGVDVVVVFGLCLSMNLSLGK